MLIDALGLENDFALECDLCIVGSGAAGLTLATALNRTSVSVCLLESGGFEMEEKTQRLYEGNASGNVPSLPESYLQTSRLRFFGGSTNHLCQYEIPIQKSMQLHLSIGLHNHNYRDHPDQLFQKYEGY